MDGLPCIGLHVLGGNKKLESLFSCYSFYLFVFKGVTIGIEGLNLLKVGKAYVM